MNYGFVINNDSCIGCHACSTACKSENEVPLGVQRTWVKSVETGQYPNVARSFQVTRCNHCANPPCVRICPVTAMYQRDDGIVEFDPDVCIGCKACMQACPYDAIYIDPDSGTAAKCHYCAHKVDLGLEPACVVVCPEHAILAGDLDDPTTEIAQAVARNKVTVRKPEQGTAPKLYYIGGEDVAMHPTAVDRTPDSFAWADVLPLHEGDGHASHKAPKATTSGKKSNSGQALRRSEPQGDPSGGPIQIGDGRMAEQMTQVVWNAQHKIPWHWQVPAYLVTKGIAAGIFLILAISALFGFISVDHYVFQASAFVSVFFLIATTGLLVADLERPERFLSIVFRPQWRSWLVRGAFLLIGFSGIATIWYAGELSVWMGWITEDWFAPWRTIVLWAGIPLAIGTAIYTAFLFGQAEGRDLWQSPLLPLHLIIQSFMAGSAVLLIMGSLIEMSDELMYVVRFTFLGSLALDLAVTLLGEFGMPHASEQAAKAAHMITKGRYKWQFWGLAIVVGHILPLAYGMQAGWAPAVAALIGLYVFEKVFVSAPQELPNS
ncbi:MAG: polysulfide reductase NrfD [Bacteroidetes Order II. Incertae sedis bacterium]|jgi:Fe-S-cluster-containing dehydrogenase component/formate-dependent nitrite reductase membrane component NrfD|nr:polysulfide reductase NrfD [Bacteroidetes Order II. bacterium]MBT4052258.1 polysulfide reductase NrfD [Bacteroidetes Order II. bacterium]MBT4603487.1 polysulfide reductase NrfD [Bacteroidetes Order II. bacterium]MBT5249616.1 polysulfide reductase NrfD [Bacteroidetes Order II. bacterium]MBT6199659.1 polysulfide reductase NrfD [Bacteroidetes Order II. bacterium]